MLTLITELAGFLKLNQSSSDFKVKIKYSVAILVSMLENSKKYPLYQSMFAVHNDYIHGEELVCTFEFFLHPFLSLRKLKLYRTIPSSQKFCWTVMIQVIKFLKQEIFHLFLQFAYTVKTLFVFLCRYTQVYN